jgi:hypothetical protein
MKTDEPMHGPVIRAAEFGIDRHSITAAALELGVPADVAEAAAERVLAGEAGGILMSGRQGAGKDTVAPLVLEACGITDAVQCRVSDAIKDEMDVIISAITSRPFDEAVLNVARAVDLREDHAARVVQILWDVTREPGHGLTGRTRTPEVRLALQYHGHEARIETHPDYWVKACYQRVLPLLAEGRIVYLTDGRFPREIEMARSIGLYTVRLYVSREVQFERIHGRDGHDPDVASLDHPGETLLDDYDGFNLVIDNSGALEPVVAEISRRCNIHR